MENDANDDSGSFLREEYWSWVGGICKCLGANARGFPGVKPPGWPLISPLFVTLKNNLSFYFTIEMKLYINTSSKLKRELFSWQKREQLLIF